MRTAHVDYAAAALRWHGGKHGRRSVRLVLCSAALTRTQSAPSIVENVGASSIQHVYDYTTGEWTATSKDTKASGDVAPKFRRLRDFFLPSGYPAKVTPDYLDYQLWALPVHVTGWITNSLATSSLLKAAGLGADPGSAVAAGAAIKWITKDGIGALGRYIVGGSLSRFFDEDPRFWRLFADYVKAGGQFMEIFTAASPGMFVLLAGGGNFAKAVGKGMSRPSFRVIQQHFARQHNVGAIAAKEEVWEVTGQLVGLLASVGVLEALAQLTDGDAAVVIIGTWAVIEALHLYLRYISLQQLQLPWVSQRRAGLLAGAYVRGEPLPSVADLSSTERFEWPKQLTRPYVHMNSSVKQLLMAAAQLSERGATQRAAPPHPNSGCSGAADGPSRSDSGNDVAGEAALVDAACADHSLARVMELYRNESYVLIPSHTVAQPLALLEPDYNAGIKADFTDTDALQLFLQTAWHAQHAQDAGDMEVLAASLEFARESSGAFKDALRAQGWDVEDVIAWSSQENVIAY